MQQNEKEHKQDSITFKRFCFSISILGVITVEAVGAGEATITVKCGTAEDVVIEATVDEAAAPTPYSSWSEDFADATLEAGVPTDGASLNYATYTYNEEGYGEVYADAGYRGLGIKLSNEDNASVANFIVTMKVKKIDGTATNMRIQNPSTYSQLSEVVAVSDEWVVLTSNNIEVAAGTTLLIQLGSADGNDSTLKFAVDDIVVERYTDWTKPELWTSWNEDFADATLEAGVPTDGASLNYATYTYNEEGYGEVYADAGYRGLGIMLNNADNTTASSFVVSMKVKKVDGTATNMRIQNPTTYSRLSEIVAVSDEWVVLTSNSIEVEAGAKLLIQLGSADGNDSTLKFAVDDITVTRTVE